MDLFLLNGDTDELSLMDMLDKDLKYSRQDGSSRSNYTSDLLMDLFDTDICMGEHIEPLFDLLPPALSGDEMADSPLSNATTPAASSCSSSSSLEDDQGRLSMERELSWFGLMEASGATSHKDYNFDVDNAIMVNPSLVLPSTLPSRLHQHSPFTNSTSGAPGPPSASPSTTVSPLLSSSPSPLLSSSPVMLSSSTSNGAVFSSSQVPTSNYATFVPASSNGHHPTQTVYIKTEPMQTSVASSTVQLSQQGANTQVTVLRPASNNITTSTTPTIIATPRQLAQHQQHQLSSNSISFSQNQQQHRVQVSTSNNRTQQTVVAHSSARMPQQQQASHHIVSSAGITTVHTTTNSSNGHLFRGKPATVRGGGPTARRPDERVLPKPAYSYSCLIALALKNSTTGSLPVSEIYNFMCEYFPYFRTAPNGWKNSVRHNLSLNKCFEKIEKPVVSGNNQRKGCLWALNPNKVHKMDEEIQKWNKKDLQGIRDAMNTPEVLGALERGEMKFEAANGASSCSEDEDEDEEVDALTLSEPPATLATLKFVNGGSHLASRTGVLVQTQQQPRATLHIHTNKAMQQPTILARQGSNGGNITQQMLTASKARGNAVLTASTTSASPVTNSPPTMHQEPDFILPDSTMTEISFQANGALVDDLGNEISIEEEVTSSSGGLLNSSVVASNVSVVSSPRSVVLRKMPMATMRSPAALRANYVYSPSIASPHHQHNLNRLVLTNAKMA